MYSDIVIPLQATINLFINWLLGLTLTPGSEKAIMEFIAHHGLATIGCASPVI